MANAEVQHETVLDAGATRSRLARVYAEAYLAAAGKESPPREEEAGAELADFVKALAANPDVATFLVSPAVGRKAKSAALEGAMRGGTSDMLRRLLGVLLANNRVNLLAGIAAAYRRILDERAGRVPVKVTAAVPLSDGEREQLTANLKKMLRQEPVLDVRVDPDLLGGMVVQVGDSVIDTSVRSRLLSLRSILLEQ